MTPRPAASAFHTTSLDDEGTISYTQACRKRGRYVLRFVEYPPQFTFPHCPMSAIHSPERERERRTIKLIEIAMLKLLRERATCALNGISTLVMKRGEKGWLKESGTQAG